MTRLGSAIGIGAIGGAIAWLVGLPFGLATATAIVGAANGALSGWLGSYDLSRGRGRLALLLDSSWGLLGVATGLLLHGANLFRRGSGYEPELSRAQDRHVYTGGFALRKGFALSLGNVVSNGGGSVGLRGDHPTVVRRRRLVTVHEDLHLWQNRWFGPLFQATYVMWMIGGLVVGTLAWPLVKGRWWNAVETIAYYDNPFEYWAYRRDDYWPPRGVHPRLAWKKRVRRRPRA